MDDVPMEDAVPAGAPAAHPRPDAHEQATDDHDPHRYIGWFRKRLADHIVGDGATEQEPD